MGIDILGAFRSREHRSNPLNVPGAINSLETVNAFLESFGGRNQSDAGEVVNIHTSLQTSTVWACLNLISRQIAINKLHLYQYDADGNRTLAMDHDYYDLVNSRPNPEQDAVAFRTAVQASIELTGNGYIEIQRDMGGRAVALWHRASQRTRPYRTQRLFGGLEYRTTDCFDNTERIIKYEDMIHIMGFTLDGFIGLDPLQHFKGSIGAKLALDKFGARFFANNATPSGILSSKVKVKPEDKNKMRDDWHLLQSGGNQRRTAVLDQETTYQQIGVDNNDSQFLESKTEVAKEIAAFFGVQGYAVGLLDKGIKANVEQQSQDLYNYCLRPRMVAWETAFSTKLFNSKGRSAGRYFVQFDTFKLLHPDDTSLMTTIQSSVQNGIMSPNEGRILMDFNTLGPVGDEHYIQLNMQTLTVANSVVPFTGQPATELALEQEENSLPRLGANYRGLFKDGVQRLIKQSNRDYKAVYRCLWPTLDALSTAARTGKNLTDFSESTKAVEKLIEGMEHRAKKWSESNIETILDEEMRRVATKLIYAVNHDVANAKSKADLAMLEADETEQENVNE